MYSAVVAEGADPTVSKATVVHDQIGNATRESDISLTFTVDKKKLANLSSLPFQVFLQLSCPLEAVINTRCCR